MKPKPDHLPILAAALLGIALYALTLGGTYIYDDVLIANADPRLHDVGRWSEFLTRPYAVGAPDRLFRPLTSLSFAVEWFLHGDRPWVMHLVNVLLYSGVCAQVALLARRIGGTRAAWVAGLLFAAHPAHVEAVAYLVGRADLVATLGLLGGLLLFTRPGPMTPRRALAVWACMILAILAKEPGMLLPPSSSPGSPGAAPKPLPPQPPQPVTPGPAKSLNRPPSRPPPFRMRTPKPPPPTAPRSAPPSSSSSSSAGPSPGTSSSASSPGNSSSPGTPTSSTAR